MAVPIPLRSDFKVESLRAVAKRTRHANQVRRPLAVAAIYDGGSLSAAPPIGGVGLQIVRDWSSRFNAAGKDGLIKRKVPGVSSNLNDNQPRTLNALVEHGPIPAVHGVIRWRLKNPSQWIWQESRI